MSGGYASINFNKKNYILEVMIILFIYSSGGSRKFHSEIKNNITVQREN